MRRTARARHQLGWSTTARALCIGTQRQRRASSSRWGAGGGWPLSSGQGDGGQGHNHRRNQHPHNPHRRRGGGCMIRTRAQAGRTGRTRPPQLSVCSAAIATAIRNTAHCVVRRGGWRLAVVTTAESQMIRCSACWVLDSDLCYKQFTHVQPGAGLATGNWQLAVQQNQG